MQNHQQQMDDGCGMSGYGVMASNAAPTKM
jgi:hypothetical protein